EDLSAAPVLSCVDAHLPPEHRRIASVLRQHAGCGARARHHARLACHRCGRSRAAYHLRSAGAHGAGYRPPAQAVPGARALQSRLDADLRLVALGLRHRRRREHRAMRYVIIVSGALGGILLFLLAAASADSSMFAGHYPLLLVLNGLIALALLGLVAYQLVKLRRALKARVFGSRLTLRFLLVFVLMAALPGALVYTVSVQFLARSIESWFGVRVDAALESGLSLGRHVLDT